MAFLAFASGILFVLNACTNISNDPAVRIPSMIYPTMGPNTYLWSTGERSSRYNIIDYAIITQIDGIDIPQQYLPAAGECPRNAWLLEVPTGEHIIEIEYRKQIIIDVLKGIYLVCRDAEKARQIITLSAELDKTYHPFVSDECSDIRIWMEDRGPYVAGLETRRFSLTTYRGINFLTNPVVTWEAPNKGSCK